MAADKNPSTPPADTDPEAGRVRSLDERFGAIEHRQEEQQGVLDKILAVVSGGGQPKDTPPPATAPGGGQADDGDIAARVRAEIDKIERGKTDAARAEADAGWRKGVEDTLEKLKAERAPREPESGIRGRIQRTLFGKQD